MDETNLLQSSLGFSLVVEVILVEYLIIGGVFLIEWLICWLGGSECEILLVGGEERVCLFFHLTIVL